MSLTKLRRAGLSAALILAFAGQSFAAPITYHLGTGPKHTNIIFESFTTVEDIIGNTNRAKGTVVFDKENLAASSVEISVPVKELKTGIPMRDEHLQSADWLDAEKFPDITFKSTKIEAGAKEGEYKVTGTMTIHGQSKELTTTVVSRAIDKETSSKAGFGDGDWMRFSGNFKVTLSDHGVDVNRGGGKVANEINIKFSLFGTTSPGRGR